MKTSSKDNIVFNFYMLKTVGVADDIFDIDVIKDGLEGLNNNNDGLHKIDEDEEEIEKDGDIITCTEKYGATNIGKSDNVFVPKLPPKAKHYLVFIFSIW